MLKQKNKISPETVKAEIMLSKMYTEHATVHETLQGRQKIIFTTFSRDPKSPEISNHCEDVYNKKHCMFIF